MNFKVVRVGSHRHRELADAGYAVAGESWGARLHLESCDGPFWRSTLEAFVTDATRRGLTVAQRDVSRVEDVVELEKSVAGDYPVTPATSHGVPSAVDIRAMVADGARIFGATSSIGGLVAVTIVRRLDDRVETDFTSVHRSARRMTLAKAVKAASILSFAEEGVRMVGTGGAAANDASLRMTSALGYVVTERWVSFDVSRET